MIKMANYNVQISLRKPHDDMLKLPKMFYVMVKSELSGRKLWIDIMRKVVDYLQKMKLNIDDITMVVISKYV